MAVPLGARLGPYEILSAIGAGGMGEVYRARDTRLDREVAVKILSDRHVGNPEARARFEREAKAVAALSHPNILALHDVGTSDDILFAITELLHGATLAEKLAGPPLPLRKAVDFALQIARGLSAAHERGVVHRDLKPENVFVTGEGLVKILDFGLARAASPAAEGGVSRMPTLGPATEPGTVLGTVGYMSPEQVRGQPLDARSDLFSFGAVLYEMLTGRRAFQADTAADTLSSILREEPPDATAAGRGIPPTLDRIVRHCLEKNPAERFQSARDLIFSLEAVASSWDSAEGKATAAAPRAVPFRGVRGIPIRALGLLLLGGALGAALGLFWGRRPPEPPPVLRTLTYSGSDSAPSASSDGRLIAYASEREGRRRIWLKQQPGGDEVALTTGPDLLPRISPDGTQVLFVRREAERESLFRIPVVGGEPRKVLDDAYEGDWSPDGRRIVFLRHVESSRGNSIGVAEASGQEARIVATVTGRLERVRWSPAGTTVAMRRLEGENAPQVMLLVDLANGSQRTLVPPPPSGTVSGPAWSGDGRALIFGQLESFVFTNVGGSTARIVRQEVATSRAGTLMWIPSPAGVIDILGPGRLVMDIQSQRANLMEVPLDGASGARGRWLTRGSSIDRQPDVSPDGRWVISSSNRTGNLDLWKLSLTDGSLRRVTEDAADDWDPAFTPDGKSIIWSSSRSGHFEIWMCDADGTGARQVTNDGFDAENPTMTPDGLWIVYSSSNPEHSGLWKIHPDGSSASLLVPGSWSTPEVSPDGVWVAFRSQALPRMLHVARVEDGEVQPFPSELPGGLFAARARWMRGSRALAFTGFDAAGALGVFVQDFVPGRDTRASRRPLSTFDPDLPIESFGIAPDGSRAIYSRLEQSSALMLAEGLPGIAPAPRPSR